MPKLERLTGQRVGAGLLGRDPGRLADAARATGAVVGGSTGALAYAAAKAGTDGLTRALSSELGPQGLAVNAIAPGYIAETRFFGDGDQTDRERLFSERIPSGRVGRPHEVAALVGFLCSADADHIRGQVLHINGGQHYAG